MPVASDSYLSERALCFAARRIPALKVAAAIAALVATITAVTSGHAQTHEPMQLMIPQSTLEQPPPASEQDDYANLAELFDHFTIYADGEKCGTVSLVDPVHRDDDGNAVYRLGQPDQHPYCATPMAFVTLVDKNGFTLHEKWTIDPGSTVVLDNFAPETPHGPPTRVLIPVFILSDDAAQRFDHFTVYADGRVCGTISLVAPQPVDQQGNIVFPLGTSDQPPACEREGALIYFKDRNGTVLLTTFWLETGATLLLRNFAPPPPHAATPGPPDAGKGIVPDHRSEAPPELGYVLMVSGLVLAGAVLFVVSRRSTSR